MALLEVEDLVGGYRADLDILHGISLAVEPGDMVSIIGPNGAGKSTVLKGIFGMILLKSGKVTFDRDDITDLGPQDTLRRGITFVPQGHNLFPEMTVEDNLRLGAYIRDDKEQLKRDIERVYEMFPVLDENRRQVAGHLSGGQMQMLEMGRAMLLDPKLVLIDEPSLGLAPKVSKEVFGSVQDMKESGVSILIVEQNAEASLRMSDYAFVIETGSNKIDGPAEEIRTNESVRRAYLGM